MCCTFWNFFHQNWEKNRLFAIGKVPLFGPYYIRKKSPANKLYMYQILMYVTTGQFKTFFKSYYSTILCILTYKGIWYSYF